MDKRSMEIARAGLAAHPYLKPRMSTCGGGVLRASRANAHSENKDEAALPVHRTAVGLCAI